MPFWSPGETVIRREILGFDPIPRADPLPAWYRRCWAAMPVIVIDDSNGQLVTYIPRDTPFDFPEGSWPTADGKHPWDRVRSRWQGHGCLTIQRPGDHYSVMHFWSGPERTFDCWYINLQTAFRRDDDGYDTQDLEVDIVIQPDGSWAVKDLDLLATRVTEGRFTQLLADWIVDLGDRLSTEIETGRWWWDRAWADWTPDPEIEPQRT